MPTLCIFIFTCFWFAFCCNIGEEGVWSISPLEEFGHMIVVSGVSLLGGVQNSVRQNNEGVGLGDLQSCLPASAVLELCEKAVRGVSRGVWGGFRVQRCRGQKDCLSLERRP